MEIDFRRSRRLRRVGWAARSVSRTRRPQPCVLPVRQLGCLSQGTEEAMGVIFVIKIIYIISNVSIKESKLRNIFT